MYTPIPIHDDYYPKRLSPHNLFYSEYKHKRPFFFHDLIKTNNVLEPLVPTLNDLKDKISYITNEYLLDSFLFEYCDYFIDYIEDEEINSCMLPLNPYAPTGIGGRGILKKWGPNQISYSIVVTYNINNNNFQLLVIDNITCYSLPAGEIEYNDIMNLNIYNNLKDIIDIKNAQFVYSGYFNSSQNTDHAWIETSVYLFILNNSQRINLLNCIKNNSLTNFKLINIDKEDPDYKLINTNDLYFLDMASNFF